MPFLTRYSARSVASMSGERPASIFLGFILMVESTPVAIRIQSFAVSTLSNINCQACSKHKILISLCHQPKCLGATSWVF